MHHDETIHATVDVDNLLTKHFAILGSTGVGKSSGVAVMINAILDARPELRVFLLDGHNEYGRCFGSRANVVNAAQLKLPFWLFNFEEFVDALYYGRPGVEEEVDILAEHDPDRQGPLSCRSAATASASACAASIHATPASPSIRRSPIRCRTSSR